MGQQWHKDGDRKFWFEEDVRACLLCRLWETIAEPVPLSDGETVVVLAHADIPVRKSMTGGKGRYDLALYEPEVIKGILEEDWRLNRYGSALAKRKALAAIEIKLMGYSLGRNGEPKPYKPSLGKIQDDIEKLKLGKDEGQIEHAYLLVFCEAYSSSESGKPRKWCCLERLKDFQGDIKPRLKELSHNVNVYWASDHPEDTPRWLHK